MIKLEDVCCYRDNASELNKCKSETFTHYERVLWCFHLEIYSGNELFKIYSLSPQECMTMEKNNYLFNLREGKLLEQFRQCLSNNKKRFLGPQFIL